MTEPQPTQVWLHHRAEEVGIAQGRMPQFSALAKLAWSLAQSEKIPPASSAQ